ncbi:MAG: hypothetical protein Ta2D_06530 [Rickettsiales bacterium]|nr:MAG: hypothetical protein Ta2D_06530 [Rickettsiales bacterium]
MLKTNYISQATFDNWNRLSSDIFGKLQKRANKRQSQKKIIPLEYIKQQENLQKIQTIIECNSPINDIIYSIASKLLKENNIKNKYTDKILTDFNATYIDFDIPNNENDLLGIVYQILLTEGDKNKKGSYYTPANLIDIDYKNTDKILDPCCGTGSFLLSYNTNPQNLYGIDIDPIACFIAKINLIIKYKNADFEPNIFCCDFLKYDLKTTFDIIATNPPWGAMLTEKYNIPQVKSGESFSYFIVKAKEFLKKDGKMSFILPISILNVAIHKDIRKFILDNFDIKIKQLGKAFNSVFSEVVALYLTQKTEISFYEKNINYNFTLTNKQDEELLEKIYSQQYLTLKDSIWGLGIVTGNNDKFIGATGSEKIWTGKEIKSFKILDTNRYIKYDRQNFQQVASEEIYRAKEKLVYKFISKNPVFAYDNQQRLFLNSVNILIPKVDGYSIKTCMAFLNSALFKYIYIKKFNEIKILKGNLMQMPFPIINKTTNDKIEKMVENMEFEKIDALIFDIFKLSENEVIKIT